MMRPCLLAVGRWSDLPDDAEHLQIHAVDLLLREADLHQVQLHNCTATLLFCLQQAILPQQTFNILTRVPNMQNASDDLSCSMT